jgi:uncharacterized protein (DUF1778 family)
MTTKKRGAQPGRSRPDLRSKKKDGIVNQSLRLTVEENNLIRKAADLERRSINSWAVVELVRIAELRIAEAKAVKISKEKD